MWELYRQMLRSRLLETAVARLWQAGDISGEMHLGTGEEAAVAGVVCQLTDGDALALDHRGTPPLVMRGLNLVALLREMLGLPGGLGGGQGGHMHLFSQEHLAASSGIVGAAGPMAVGFALANRQLRPGKIAVAFFGEGAMNQGMLLESLNLAVVWQLPVVFVCKDNGWAIATESALVRGGTLADRAKGFGLAPIAVDGWDVTAVWFVAQDVIARARLGEGPAFLHVHCAHLEGHFLGDPLLQMWRRPAQAMLPAAGPLARALLQGDGAPLRERLTNLKWVLSLVRKSQKDHQNPCTDPLTCTRALLLADEPRLQRLEEAVCREIELAVDTAVASQAGSE